MNYMIVKQKVRDLAQFQKAFDGLQRERQKAGLTDLGQFALPMSLTRSSS